jgi:TPR repeat protein
MATSGLAFRRDQNIGGRRDPMTAVPPAIAFCSSIGRHWRRSSEPRHSASFARARPTGRPKSTNITSAPIRTALIAALFCAASLVLPHAHAQQGDADAKQVIILRAEAEKGDAKAQNELGAVFFLGKFGTATNYAEALRWWRKAAEQDYSHAQYNLGLAYANGQGLAKDEAEAAKWYRKAAEQNYAEAQYNLAVCFRDGQGVAKDDAEAAKWFCKAAEQDDAKAQYDLGLCYELNRGIARDVVEAVKWYRKAAEIGCAPAQCNLGNCYSRGQGVAKDDVEAVKWFRKAAEQQDAMAQDNLGVCYRDGLGVLKDEVEAVKWFRRAAGQNYVAAQYNLGVCYRDGLGLPSDWREAIQWFLKAAGQNDALAQNNLGACFANGQGAPRDYVEGYKWFLLAGAQDVRPALEAAAQLEHYMTREQRVEGQKRASEFKPQEISSRHLRQGWAVTAPPPELRASANSGDAKAQNELGEAFRAGKRGAARDPVEAVKWFRKAAEQNLPRALSNLGVCYERGEGVAKYEVEAYKWDLLGAAQGDTKAKRNASMLELMMSQEEIAEGKRRADVWLEERKTAPLKTR